MNVLLILNCFHVRVWMYCIKLLLKAMLDLKLSQVCQ
jgi:hypothetical protein